MKTFLKIFGSSIFTTFFVLVIFALIIKTYLLNPDAVKSTYRNNTTYEGISKIVGDELRKNVKAPVDSPEFSQIPKSEQEKLLSQIDVIYNLFPTSRVQDVIETNLDRILPFIDGKTNELTIYFPINQWGLPKELIEGSFLTRFSENTDSQTLVELFVPSSRAQAQDFLNTVNSVGPFLTSVIIVFSILSVGLFIFLFWLEDKKKRLRSSGVLVLWIGIYILISSLAVKGLVGSINNSSIFANESLATKLLQQLFPPLILEISNRLLFVSVLSIIAGVVFILFWFILNRRRNMTTTENQDDQNSNSLASDTKVEEADEIPLRSQKSGS